MSLVTDIRSAWANLRLRDKGMVVVAIPLVSFLAIAAALSVTQAAAERHERARRETAAVRQRTQSVLKLMVDAETGVRGFLLTQEPEFLDPYQNARTKLPAALDGFRRVATPFPAVSTERIDSVESLVRQRVAILERLIQMVDHRSSPRLIRTLKSGKAVSDRLRSTLGNIDADVERVVAEREADAQRALDRQQLVLVAGIAVGLGGGVLAMMLFTTGVVNRMRRLQENAARLERGELDLEPIADARDEIGALSASVAQAGRVLLGRERDLKQAHMHLEDAKQEAEEANQAKTEFVSRMSHELRTPLNAILGFSQLLELDGLTDEQKDSLRQISNAGTHLLGLINELLDISRIEAGDLLLSLEPVSIDEVVRESLALVGPMAADREIEIRFDVEDGLCQRDVYADRQRLKQVLLNLLSNGIKYNHARGTLSISCDSVDESKLRLSIRDTGPGIREKDIGRLFTPFDRLGAEGAGVEGTGLGLPLSKRLVELMGGSMTVESTLGEGSIFSVTFREAEHPIKRLSGTEPDDVDVEIGEPSGGTLLYIEDNLSNLKLVERILRRRPAVTLLPAMQGRLGLTLAAKHLPDLILLDLNLPDMSGRDVLRELKHDHRTKHIPVIVLSADATQGQVDRLKDRGAAGYVTKPFDVNEFLRTIDRMIVGERPVADEL